MAEMAFSCARRRTLHILERFANCDGINFDGILHFGNPRYYGGFYNMQKDD
jgi:hypothetical protein